jgi:DNA-binding transcriptional MerR regulator
MTIGRLSSLTGVKVTTIRYYEREGLLPEPRRTAAARRMYAAADAQRLSFIRHARQLGFETPEVRVLLDLADHRDRSCEEVDRIARRRLEAVDDKIARLMRLRGELERMVEECRHGTVAQCRVIDTLSDHGLCAAEH